MQRYVTLSFIEFLLLNLILDMLVINYTMLLEIPYTLEINGCNFHHTSRFYIVELSLYFTF